MKNSEGFTNKIADTKAGKALDNFAENLTKSIDNTNNVADSVVTENSEGPRFSADDLNGYYMMDIPLEESKSQNTTEVVSKNSVDSTGENIGENTSENIREKTSENVPKKIENEILFILKMSTVDKIKFTLRNFGQNFFIKKSEARIKKSEIELERESMSLVDLAKKLESEKKQYDEAIAGITDPEIIETFKKNRAVVVIKLEYEIKTKKSIISEKNIEISNQKKELTDKKEKITSLRQDFSAKVDRSIEIVKKNTKYEQIKEQISKSEEEVKKTVEIINESNKIVEQIEKALENKKMLRWVDSLRLKSRLRESKKHISKQKDSIYFLSIDIRNLKKEQALIEESIKKWELLKVTEESDKESDQESDVKSDAENDNASNISATTAEKTNEAEKESEEKIETKPNGESVGVESVGVESNIDSNDRTKKMILEMVLSVFEKQRKEKEILNNVLEKINSIRDERNPDNWRAEVINLSKTGILDDLNSLNHNQSGDSVIADTIELFEEILNKAENISQYNKNEFDDDFDNLITNIESCINSREI